MDARIHLSAVFLECPLSGLLVLETLLGDLAARTSDGIDTELDAVAGAVVLLRTEPLAMPKRHTAVSSVPVSCPF